MTSSRFRNVCTSAMALVVALWLSGGQFMVLQVTAWSGMLVTRTLENGVEQALESTFDGEHPCALCKVISGAQDNQSTGKSPAPVKSEGKLKIDASVAVNSPLQHPNTLVAEINWPDMIPLSLTCELEPLVPPPRLAA